MNLHVVDPSSRKMTARCCQRCHFAPNFLYNAMYSALTPVSFPTGSPDAAFSWSSTALGDASGWSRSLHTVIQLVMDAPLPMFVLWGAQRTLVYNPAFSLIAGQRHPQAFGCAVAQVWPGLWQWDDDLVAAGLPGALLQFADQPLANDSPTHRFDLFYTPVADDAGQLGGMLCIVVDSSRRVQAERAATQDRVRIAHDAGGIGTFEWFPITDQMITSDSYRALWGFTPDQTLDTAMLTALVDVQDHHLLGTTTDGNRHNPLTYAEFRIRRIDTGERRWLARRGEVIGDGILSTRRYVGVAFDITERKLVEETLAVTEHQLRIFNDTLEHRVLEESDRRARAEEALHQSQKMEAIGQLTGGVAHDFNNVLHIIGGNLQLLQSHVCTDAIAQKRLDVATAAVMRGAKLSSQLLAFARRQPLQPTVVNLGELVLNMTDLLRRALGETIALDIQVAPSLWSILADQSQLENVILNLAINSRDAISDSGQVTITLDNFLFDVPRAGAGDGMSAGNYVLLAVRDDGAGMTADVMQKAFEPFFTTKGEGQGTGLGLSMAYGFVKQSHGHIKLDSAPGCGTTLRIYLPRTLEPAACAPQPLKGSVQGGTETILVVEDDPAVQETVVDTLRALGYAVLKAEDGACALAMLHRGVKVDLLFTDVVMPGALRSPDLARQARLLLPALAVLFTSGYTQDAIVHGGRLDPGVDLLSKPYHRDQLAQKIRRSLDAVRPAANACAPARSPMPAASTSVTPPIDSVPPRSTVPVDIPLPSRPLRILVVEDNPDLCQLVCELLVSFGHQPTPAGNAEEALARIGTTPVDVLLTDVRLPGMSGIDLARKILLTHPDTHVIFASGYGAEVIANVNFPAHALAKPYDIGQLHALIRSL